MAWHWGARVARFTLIAHVEKVFRRLSFGGIVRIWRRTKPLWACKEKRLLAFYINGRCISGPVTQGRVQEIVIKKRVTFSSIGPRLLPKKVLIIVGNFRLQGLGCWHKFFYPHQSTLVFYVDFFAEEALHVPWQTTLLFYSSILFELWHATRLYTAFFQGEARILFIFCHFSLVDLDIEHFFTPVCAVPATGF